MENEKPAERPIFDCPFSLFNFKSPIATAPGSDLSSKPASSLAPELFDVRVYFASIVEEREKL